MNYIIFYLKFYWSDWEKDATKEIASTKNQGKETYQEVVRKTGKEIKTKTRIITVSKGFIRVSEVEGGIAFLLESVETFEEYSISKTKNIAIAKIGETSWY